jgi:class 3 adenylate cyclase
MENQFKSYIPGIFAAVAVSIFIFTSIVFLVYDTRVEQRQRLVMTTVNQSTAVLSSLFPEAVLDKVMMQDSGTNPASATSDTFHTTTTKQKSERGVRIGKRALCDITPVGIDADKSFRRNLSANSSNRFLQKFTSPIADLYPNTTVFFADICGFTAWSSSRGPDHVFILLESLYSEFDMIANRRKVFKVETIGDSYVAVAGIPDPMKKHAIVITKFAEEILHKMKVVVNELCTCLGPDTATLQLRVGLNSGPTTAGVIRGEKARFQLFGDTVNTAARMESTGCPGRIQCSSKTAELLRQSGNGHWLKQRDDVVKVKGKGEMTTFWVQIQSQSQSTTQSTIVNSDCTMTNSGRECISSSPSDLFTSRIMEWIFDVFQSLLCEVMSFQLNTNGTKLLQVCPTCNDKYLDGKGQKHCTSIVPFDEVVDVLDLPCATIDSYLALPNNDTVMVDRTIMEQLMSLLTMIAQKYRENAFHNFEHACHVVMSAKNLLDRSCVPCLGGESPQQLNLDPLSRFAAVFGALIHDIDHPGVSNIQLTKEQANIATQYNNRCIAEQNSFEIGWRLFMEPQFIALRQCLFPTNHDYNRFRQVTLNVVMATDVFDRDLTTLRQSRWDHIFVHTPDTVDDSIQSNNRKATICIELLIQASDVIHTMQHWTVYQKWNCKLFEEMHLAYQQGRLEKNPCLTWYDGELWFFDNYVIPLANKLQLCNVFGANSDAFLDFASDNRTEWESKGRSIVEKWTQDFNESWETYSV